MFDLYLFIFVDILSHNFVLAGVVAFLVDMVLLHALQNTVPYIISTLYCCAKLNYSKPHFLPIGSEIHQELLGQTQHCKKDSY